MTRCCTASAGRDEVAAACALDMATWDSGKESWKERTSAEARGPVKSRIVPGGKVGASGPSRFRILREGARKGLRFPFFLGRLGTNGIPVVRVGRFVRRNSPRSIEEKSDFFQIKNVALEQTIF